MAQFVRRSAAPKSSGLILPQCGKGRTHRIKDQREDNDSDP